jgi:DNA repair exonuclease SbcCD nuclease subunit
VSKIVIFSDLHGHPFKAYATLLPNGRNSRLNDAVEIVKQVRHVATQVGAELVVFGGDLFHVRKNIPVAAFNPLYGELSQLPVSSQIDVLMIHGNHDQADRVGEEYSIYAMGAFATVVDKPGWVHVRTRSGEDLNVMAIPYTEDIPSFKQMTSSTPPVAGAVTLMIGHFGVQGAEVGADFVYTNPYDAAISDLSVENYDAIFLGHYHKHQQIAPNAWYIGAPLHHNWGDRHDPGRGCLVYDTETNTFERVALSAPEFVEIQEEDLDDHAAAGDLADDFVRIVAKTAWTEKHRDDVRSALMCRSLEVIPPKKRLTPQHDNRLQVDPTMGANDVIVNYVQSGIASTDGLDEGYLVQLGQEILAEVENTK